MCDAPSLERSVTPVSGPVRAALTTAITLLVHVPTALGHFSPVKNAAPLPTARSALLPEQYTRPFVNRAQACPSPATTAATPVSGDVSTGPKKKVGRSRCVTVSLQSPSWPKSLLPQHRPVLSEIVAQVVWFPAEMSMTDVSTPLLSGLRTRPGVGLVVPLPSWPRELSPQQRTVPLFNRAEV